MREAVLGDLRVRITGGVDREGSGTGPVVVLMHGFGAPGTDLVSLWRVIDAPAGTRFVFPEAPLTLDGAPMGGRAWWMIDLERAQRAMTSGEQVDRSNEVPDGLEEARRRVVDMLDALHEELSPDEGQLVLGGFSQGAMLACDVALRHDVKLAGLVLMSGTLIAQKEWQPLMAARTGLPVLQSHGRTDPLLPFSAAERLRDLLLDAGLDVQWVPFNGPHTIGDSVVDELGRFLRRQLEP